MRAITLALGLLAAARLVGAGSQAPAASPASPHETLIEKFLNNRAEPLHQYRATRRLEATNQRFGKHGGMDVRTELSDGGFSFEVLGEGGAGIIRRHRPTLRPRRRRARPAQRRVGRTRSPRRAIGTDDDLPVRDGERAPGHDPGSGAGAMTMEVQWIQD